MIDAVSWIDDEAVCGFFFFFDVFFYLIEMIDARLIKNLTFFFVGGLISGIVYLFTNLHSFSKIRYFVDRNCFGIS